VKTPKTAATPSSAIGGGENLTAAMRPSPGTYSVDWHVTSDDGHIIGGSWKFTLLPSGSKDVIFESFHCDIPEA
jgi:methionine-rich copper-binding protein CopC